MCVGGGGGGGGVRACVCIPACVRIIICVYVYVHTFTCAWRAIACARKPMSLCVFEYERINLSLCAYV